MHKARVIADLLTRLKATPEGGWQYLEVKQLGEILARHREKARLCVREYRILKETIAAESDPIEKLYLGYEAMFARDHLRDSLRMYVMINHDFHEAYDAYMEEAKHPAPVLTPLPVRFLETRPPETRPPEMRTVSDAPKSAPRRKNAA